MPSDQITIRLDRARPVRWTQRAIARNASLARPVSFSALSNPRRRLYVLCAILWAALVERDHEMAEPEDLAEWLQTADQQSDAIKAVSAMLAEAFPEKKNPANDASLPTGPSQSSSSDLSPASNGGI